VLNVLGNSIPCQIQPWVILRSKLKLNRDRLGAEEEVDAAERGGVRMDKAKDLEEQRLMKLLKSTFEGGFMLGCRIAGRAAPFPTTEMEATWKALESTSSDGVRVILDAVRKAGPP
jgi:hypothetical protein